MTVERRQTACGMRHCFARRIVETGGRRKLGCTSTRWAERHPQGVCRIRKAAEPPTAAQQRIIEAEANHIATLNAAMPRAGKCNRQASQLFELLACNVKTFLLGDLKGVILFRERESPPFDPCRACGAAMPPRAQRARLNPSKPVWRPHPQKSEELPLRFFCTARIVKVLTMSIQQLSRGVSKRRRSSRRAGCSV